MTSPRIYGVRIFIPSSCLLAFSTKLKGLWLSGRTLVTDRPEELAIDDVPVLEFSLIDITLVKADEGAMADMISRKAINARPEWQMDSPMATVKIRNSPATISL